MADVNGSGARESLALNLFMSQGVDICPAPLDDVTRALSILNNLFNDGALDCLPTDAAYDSLREMESCLKRAGQVLQSEAALRSGHA